MNCNNIEDLMTAESALIKNAQELQRLLDEHCRLLSSSTFSSCTAMKGSKCLSQDCPHKRKFKETLINTIETLEETRKAFKSKQIEILRRKLTVILSEEI